MKTKIASIIEQADRLDELVKQAKRNPKNTAKKIAEDMLDINFKAQRSTDIGMLACMKPKVLAKIFSHGILINNKVALGMGEVFAVICHVNFDLGKQIFLEAMHSHDVRAEIACASSIVSLARTNPDLAVEFCKNAFAENTLEATKILLLAFDCLANSYPWLLFGFYKSLVLTENIEIYGHMIQALNFLFHLRFDEAFYVLVQAAKAEEKIVRYHLGISLGAIILRRPKVAKNIFQRIFEETYDVQIAFHLVLLGTEKSQTTSKWIAKFYKKYPEIKKQRDSIITE